MPSTLYHKAEERRWAPRARKALGELRLSAGRWFWTAVWWAPIACAALVVLGSMSFRSTRIFSDQSTWSEGAARWAGWTFFCGFAGVTLLVLAAVLPKRWGAIPALILTIPFAAAAYLARQNWLRLLDERSRPLPLFDERGQQRDYELHIASGLPVVTVAASAGVALALILALAILWRGKREEFPDSWSRPTGIRT